MVERKMTSNEVKKILMEKSALAIFPDLLNAVLESGRVMDMAAGIAVFSAMDGASEVVIPLTDRLVRKIETGRTGEWRTVMEYPLGALVGLSEAIDGGPASSWVISESPNIVLRIPARVFTEYHAKKSHSIDALKFLNVAPALLRFLLLAKNHVSEEKIFSLLEQVDMSLKTIDPRSPIVQLDEIIFLRSGGGRAKIIREATLNDVEVSIGKGMFIGASLLSDLGKVRMQVIPSGPLGYSSIPLAAVRATLGASACELISRETDEERERVSHLSEDLIENFHDDRIRKLPLSWIHQEFRDVAIDKIQHRGGPHPSALACLLNIGTLLGIDIAPVHLRHEIETHPRLSLGQLGEILEHHGLITRAYSGAFEGLSRQRVPAITFFKSRPVVILKTARRSVVLLDGSDGLLEVESGCFLEKWNGQALEVLSSPIEEALWDARTKRYFFDLARIADESVRRMLGDQRAYWNLFQIGLICVFLEMCIPRFFEAIVDVVVIDRRFDSLPVFAFGFSLFAFAVAVCAAFRKYFSNLKMHSLSVFVSSLLFRQFLQFPSNAGESRTGEFVSRFTLVRSLVESSHRLKSDRNLAIVSAVLTLMVIFAYSWTVAVVCAVFAFVALSIRRHFMIERLHCLPGVAQVRKAGFDIFADQLAFARLIKSRGAEGQFSEHAEKNFLRVVSIVSRSIRPILAGNGLNELVQTLGYGICLAILVQRTELLELTPGGFLAAIAYTSWFWSAITKCGDAVESHAFFKFESGALGLFMRNDSEYSRVYSSRVQPLRLKGKIQLSQSSYKYSQNSPFRLNEIDLTILPGQTVAIVGQSGEGKTTLGKIIAGTLKPRSGRILYDDVDSTIISNFSLREKVAFVPQQPVIFKGTIAENIAFGSDCPDLERVKEAARRASAHLFIEALPSSYHFFLNGRDCALSTGERMLITIARALYRDPQVLILDEPNAHLDPRATRELSENLRVQMAGKTIIFISQKIFNLRGIDQIIVLKKGWMVESGSHDSLMRQNREYLQLYRSQVSGY